MFVHTASAGEAWLPKARCCVPRASVSKDRTWKLPEMSTVFLLYCTGQVVVELKSREQTQMPPLDGNAAY